MLGGTDAGAASYGGCPFNRQVAASRLVTHSPTIIASRRQICSYIVHSFKMHTLECVQQPSPGPSCTPVPFGEAAVCPHHVPGALPSVLLNRASARPRSPHGRRQGGLVGPGCCCQGAPAAEGAPDHRKRAVPHEAQRIARPGGLRFYQCNERQDWMWTVLCSWQTVRFLQNVAGCWA